MTQFIFMARTHEHIHINAVIWSIEQAHQLQWKPHDVCFQRLTGTLCNAGTHAYSHTHTHPHDLCTYASHSVCVYASLLHSMPRHLISPPCTFAHKFSQFCTHISHLFWHCIDDRQTHCICVFCLRALCLAFSLFVHSFISRQKYQKPK